MVCGCQCGVHLSMYNCIYIYAYAEVGVQPNTHTFIHTPKPKFKITFWVKNQNALIVMKDSNKHATNTNQVSFPCKNQNASIVMKDGN